MLAAVAVAAAALIPTVMVASPAQAAPIDFLAISSAANWEGGDLVFDLTYTGTVTGTFDFSTVAGTASSGTDFTALPTSPYFGASDQTIAFPATTATSGPSKATVTVHALVNGDSVDNEQFKLRAVATGGDPSSDPHSDGTGTIWDLDPTNHIVLSGATTVPETATNGVQKSVTITATDTNPQAHDVVIPVATIDGPGGTVATSKATSVGGLNRDYTALPSDATIVIPANQTVGTTTVQLWDDNSDEADVQYFTVQEDTSRTTLGGDVVSDPTAVKIGIKDDDATPTVSIGDAVTTVEGGRLIFPLTLSNPSEQGVSVHVTAAGVATGSATAATVDAVDDATNTDAVWNNSSPTVNVPMYAKTTNVMMTTTTNPTGAFEGPENVRATVTTPVNSTLGSPTTANGLITDAGPGQTLFLSSGSMVPDNTTRAWTEGNSGAVDQKIYLAFQDGTLPATLNYSFVDGTATNGKDYVGASGSITVPASTDGTPIVSIPVTIIGDRINETNETFKLLLTDPNGIADSTYIGEQTFTITDDDPAPSWTTQDVTVQEGNSGQTMAHIPVTLSGPAASDITFPATVSNGNALDVGSGAGSNDYDPPAVSGVTIKAGDTTGTLDVPINGDTVYERDESFTVAFTNPGGVTTTGDTVLTSRVTIRNDDTAPTVTFAQYSGAEGSTVTVNGTVVGASQYPYSIGFTVTGSGDNPAVAGTDFDVPTTLSSDVAQIPAGFTGLLTDSHVTGYTPLQFTLDNDSIDEPTETFAVTANEVTSPLAGFTSASATVKISDDPLDQPPTAAIEDVSIGESEMTVDVPVDLTFASDNDATSTTQTVTIPYWTQDGSAIAGQDYKATKGVLSIPPGTTMAKINVPIIDDNLKEPNEDFFVKLGKPGPAGATLGKDFSEVVIDANDPNGVTPKAPTIKAPATVTGAATVPITGVAGAGDAVELWGAPWGVATLTKLATATAGSTGAFGFSPWIATGYQFQVRVGEMKSAVAMVRVNQAPTLTVSTGKGKLSLSVRGNPHGAKQTVIVQRLSGGKWITGWKGMTGTNHRWSAMVSERSKSSWTLRAYVAGSAMGINGGYSAVKKVTIK